MVRMSKQGERRAKCPKKRQNPVAKTGAKKENLPKGYKPHANALEGTSLQTRMFVPKI